MKIVDFCENNVERVKLIFRMFVNHVAELV